MGDLTTRQEKIIKQLAAHLKREYEIEVDPSVYGPFVQALALHIDSLEKRIDALEAAEGYRKMMENRDNDQ